MENLNNNIYAKLQRARVKLQECDLTKSGENKFSKYKYFELKDFLPAINKILDEEKLFSIVEIDDKIGNLLIINSENTDERVVFSVPSAKMDMKGSNEIQQIGAVQTYIRRYLYVNAFEIAENDQIDAGGEIQEPKKTKSGASKNEISNKDELSALKEKVVELCKELSDKDKRKEVNEIILQFHKTPNPSTIRDVNILKEVYEKLKSVK